VKKTSVYLEPDLDEALARRAADEGLTKAEFIRRTLAGAVQRPRRVRPQAVGLSDAAPARLAAEDERHLRAPGAERWPSS
jgi:Ribbon-helix-helix protein, copG family